MKCRVKPFPARMIAAVLILAAAFSLTSCREEKERVRVSRPLMGTLVTFVMEGDPSASAGAAGRAFAEIERIQKLFSVYDKKSYISVLNRRGGAGPVKVNREIFEIISRSVEISRASAGAFDITYVPAASLWDYRSKVFTPPAEKKIKKILPLMGYRNIVLNKGDMTVRFARPGVETGLGGIAKGYAIAQALETLKNGGMRNVLVDAGGDIQVAGSPSGRLWLAGLKHPRKEGLIGRIELEDMDSVATSGDYERFAVYEGKRYHHIIDTATGRPADSGLISVSVISKDPVQSDAWATAFFVMGLDKSRDYLERDSSMSVILIDENMKIYVSAGLEGRVRPSEGYELIYF